MDDKTAISVDVDATAITTNKSKATSSFFSMFDQNNGNNGHEKRSNANIEKLKFMENVIDEATVEDDPAFAKERAKYGKNPVIKKQKNGNVKKIIIISAIAAVIAIAIAVAGTIYMSSPQRLEKLLLLGDKYLAEFDYENALLAFEKALEIDSKNERAYVGLTKSYIGLGRYDEALDIINKAISLIGETDELVDLRRRVYVKKCGKEGLYLGDGTFIPDGGSLTLAETKEAFVYYSSDVSISLSGCLIFEYVKYPNLSTEVGVDQAEIVADTICSFKETLHVYEYITAQVLHQGGDRCELHLYITNNQYNSDYEKNLYHVSCSASEVEAAVEDLGKDNEYIKDLVKPENDIEQEEGSRNIEENDDRLNETGEEAGDEAEESEQSQDETKQQNRGGGLYLSDGTRVEDNGTVALSDLMDAEYVIGGNKPLLFVAWRDIQPYYVENDPEPNWAYSGRYEPGTVIPMKEYAESFLEDSEWIYSGIPIPSTDFKYLYIQTAVNNDENSPYYEYNYYVTR